MGTSNEMTYTNQYNNHIAELTNQVEQIYSIINQYNKDIFQLLNRQQLIIKELQEGVTITASGVYYGSSGDNLSSRASGGDTSDELDSGRSEQNHPPARLPSDIQEPWQVSPRKRQAVRSSTRRSGRKKSNVKR